MKGREFFKESYAKSITPWSGMKRVDELTEEFIGLIRGEIPTGKVLDIGCGEGRVARSFTRMGFDAYGIDYVTEPLVKELEITRRGPIERCSFILGDVLSWPFRNGVFDIAADNGCFHHVTKGDWKRYISGLLRVMKPKAFFMLTVFTDEDMHSQRNKRNWIYHKGHYDHFFTIEELKRAFERWFEFMRIEKSRGGEYTFHHLLLRRV